MFTRRQLLASVFPATIATKKGKQEMAWSNTLNDPLTFPITGGGQPVLAIGSKLPPELITFGFTSAIIFYQADGSYIAIGGTVVGSFEGMQTVWGNGLGSVQGLFYTQDNAGILPKTLYLTDLGFGGGNAWLTPTVSLNAPALGAGFVDFNTINASFAPRGYRIDADGWLHLQGLAYNNSGGIQVVGNTVLTSLPPLSGKIQVLPTSDGAGNSLALQVAPSGVITIQASPAGGVANLQNVCLDGISYYVGRTGT